MTMPTIKEAPQAKLQLPNAPHTEQGPVKAWSEPVTMRSYLPEPAEIHPMFLDRRVYQGSSGRIYPLPSIDRIASEPVNAKWQAIHIENEHIPLMILPELGGRMYIGYDKVTAFDSFYRQNVIKPALVGLAGPWVSGGVPQAANVRAALHLSVWTEPQRSV